MTFNELRIVEPILRALRAEGYLYPTPIQEQAIPILLRGKDLLGCAQTGTGKTAAFAVPILQNLFLDKHRQNRDGHANDKRYKSERPISALVVTPTRELALQIADSFSAYGRFTGVRNTVIFGGVKQGAQVRALRKGVDVLVATPGRLLDLIQQGFISLSEIRYFVLDEADHMLDMGFIHDIKKIIAKLPQERQSLFFSATMPREIVDLSHKILGHPEKVTVKPEQRTAEKVEQAMYYVSKQGKSKLLVHLLESESVDSALVFSRTKHGADKIVRLLNKAGIHAAAIHGNKSQSARQRALGDFKSGRTNVLVATDIAARGIDVDELSHVFNYDLPNVAETYVHRIGRTGRAKASGIALSFCDVDEKGYLRDIQKLIDQKIPVVSEHPFNGDDVENAPEQKPAPSGGGRSQRSFQRPRPSNPAKRGGRNRSWSGNTHSAKRSG